MATEKRLIDANTIPWEEYYVPDPDINAQWDFKKELSVSKPVVDKMPTVDAVEVVHGRWVLAKPRVKGRNATYRCTVCGKLRSSYYNDVFQWEYCPCGAKMDGDGNG